MILSLLVKRPLTCTLSAKAGHVLRGTVCLTAGKPDGCAQYVPKFWPGTVLPVIAAFRGLPVTATKPGNGCHER